MDLTLGFEQPTKSSLYLMICFEIAPRALRTPLFTVAFEYAPLGLSRRNIFSFNRISTNSNAMSYTRIIDTKLSVMKT